MSDTCIFHICDCARWTEALKVGVYEGGELDRRDGFIHFSTRAQARETAARYLHGTPGLVLLEVDAAALGDALKWEESRDNLLFPHLYAPLETSAVTRVYDLPLDAEGNHVFPKGF